MLQQLLNKDEGGEISEVNVQRVFKSFMLNVLRLLKVILLQKRVLVISSHEDITTQFIQSLLSLLPLQKHIPPPTSNNNNNDDEHNDVANNNDNSNNNNNDDDVYAHFGLPLPLFNDKYIVKYHLPTDQLASVIEKHKGFVIGIVDDNPRFNDYDVDVIVRPEKSMIRYKDRRLRTVVELGRPDRHYIWNIVEACQLYHPSPHPDRDMQMGSTIWVKQQIDHYFSSFFSVLIKLTFPETKLQKEDEYRIDFHERIKEYNEAWSMEFMGTECFNEWIHCVDISYFSTRAHIPHPSRDKCGVGFPHDFWDSNIGKFVSTSMCCFLPCVVKPSLSAPEKDI